MKCATLTGGMDLWSAAKIGATLMAFALLPACGRSQKAQVLEAPPFNVSEPLLTGAERTAEYLPLLLGQRVAIVANRTGMIGPKHLVDSLLALKVNITKVFAPEHGFRGDADAGEHVRNGLDSLTQLPLVSLYGDNKKPSAAQLEDVDVLLFDIQDVGVRFYTYISTLHYVMEAAAEHTKKVIVLDRPNPNGFYVDGPVLDPAFKSFVGMHPVPLVHGMTIGEYAGMLNGEGWLNGGKQCDLHVVPCSGYTHESKFTPPIRPSPNLPNGSSIWLYPSLGLFEGTIVSVGRGTAKPFQCIGYPGCSIGRYRFTPQAMSGAKNPPYLGKECSGMDLQDYGAFQSRMEKRINLQWLIGMYRSAPDSGTFFTPFFDKLAGGSELRQQIASGVEEETIRASWRSGLDAFRLLRAKYLLYPDITP